MSMVDSESSGRPASVVVRPGRERKWHVVGNTHYAKQLTMFKL